MRFLHFHARCGDRPYRLVEVELAPNSLPGLVGSDRSQNREPQRIATQGRGQRRQGLHERGRIFMRHRCAMGNLMRLAREASRDGSKRNLLRHEPFDVRKVQHRADPLQHTLCGIRDSKPDRLQHGEDRCAVDRGHGLAADERKDVALEARYPRNVTLVLPTTLHGVVAIARDRLEGQYRPVPCPTPWFRFFARANGLAQVRGEDSCISKRNVLRRSKAEIATSPRVLHPQHPGSRPAVANEEVKTVHIGMSAGTCMFDLESSQCHLKLRNEVPHQVPHFDPDLTENCGTHWLDSFQVFATRSRSWDVMMVPGISGLYP